MLRYFSSNHNNGTVGMHLLCSPLLHSALIWLTLFASSSHSAPEIQNSDPRLLLPDGFSLSIYARNLPHARMLAISNAGDLLVSQPRDGQVTLLMRDNNGDGLPDGRRVLIDGLNRPHGIDLDQDRGWLYIAESDAVGRIRFNGQTGEVSGRYHTILTDLDDSGSHWSKSLSLGPDGWLYLSAGSSCNVCVEDNQQRATIMRVRPDGSDFQIYASGLRNSVGMDWAPWDQSLYATDNGRDWLGDDFPPCELNKIVKNGFYGWPYINGFAQLDPDLGEDQQARLTTAHSPVHGFRAHNAPLGIRFLRHSALPKEFQRTALVALHGSWNRSEPDGYKVVALRWRDDASIEERDFLSGFLQGRDVIGRPVDIAEGPRGEIFISDDYTGTIYRVAFVK